MTVSDAERLARVTLNAVSEPGHLRLCRLVTEIGGVEVARALHDRRLGPMGDDLAARLDGVDPEGLLAAAERQGIRFVVPGDDEWPIALDDLDHAPPLHDRGGTPVGLWVRGPRRLAAVVERAVAVVGSRSATTYGTDISGDLAAGVSRAGITVVSGGAFGIDQAAHRGALAVRGPTVAVLACGVDRFYPASHVELLRYIADTGLLVSEAPLGGAPMKVRFLARNRLIAGLSQGTVVVEAAIRSGALNSANWAGGLGRVVMAVPGPVTSATSEGTHRLVRERDALLVTRVEEVLEAIAPAGSALITLRGGPARATDALTTVERQVLDAVPVGRAASTTAVARTAGVRPQRVTTVLGRLTLLGLVQTDDTGWRLAAVGDEVGSGFP